jgi:hypothetical protein
MVGNMRPFGACAALLIATLLSCRHGAPETKVAPPPRREHPTPRPPKLDLVDAAYVRKVLDEQGVPGLVDKLYVAPPDVLSSLDTGIASGAPDWLDVYQRLRGATALPEPTRRQLDDALVRALVPAAERVLRVLHDHAEIRVADICGTATGDGVLADVVDEPGLLAILRRRPSLQAVTSPELRQEKFRCLDALELVIRRQWRIYGASYGAADAKTSSRQNLSEADRRELDAAVAAARADGQLATVDPQAYAAGPFRLEPIPDAFGPCFNEASGLANPEGPWEFSDCITDERLPNARILGVCRTALDDWNVVWQQGGFVVTLRQCRAHRQGSGWTFVTSQFVGNDPWQDCRTLGVEQTPSKPLVEISPDGRALDVRRPTDEISTRFPILDRCRTPNPGPPRIRLVTSARGNLVATYGKSCSATIRLDTLALECNGCD